MNLQLGIFDWNGTLLDDWSRLQMPFMHDMCAYFGLTFPGEKIYRNILGKKGFIEVYYELGVSREKYPEKMLVELSKRKRIEAMCERWVPGLLRPYARETLKLCTKNGIKCILVTGEIHEVVLYQLRRLGIKDFFTEIHTESAEKGDIMRDILERHNTEGRDAFCVDDTAGSIEAANALDILTFGMLEGFSSRIKIKSANPTYPIKSLLTVYNVVDDIVRSV